MQIPIGLPLFLWTSLASYLYNSGVLPLLSFLHVLPYNTTGSMSAAPAPPPPNKRESKFQISRFIRDSYAPAYPSPRPSYTRTGTVHRVSMRYAYICAYAHDHMIMRSRWHVHVSRVVKAVSRACSCIAKTAVRRLHAAMLLRAVSVVLLAAFVHHAWGQGGEYWPKSWLYLASL